MTKIERLNHVEELEYIKQVQNGNSKYALNKLLRHNTGLVHKIVNQIGRAHV